MTDPHDLGRAIGDLVPDPPAAHDRASSVLRLARRHRRRRALAGTTAAVVAVAGIAFGATALGPFETRIEPATPSPSTTAVGCPPGGRAAIPSISDPLPEHATAARLCSPNGEYDGPADVLVTGVGQLVDAVRALPDHVPSECDWVGGGDAFWIVVGYADGSSRNIRGELGDCDRLDGAGGVRDDANEVWDLYLRLVRQQRSGATPPGGEIRCPVRVGERNPLGSVVDADHAVLTWSSLDHLAGPTSCAPVPDADLRVIQADLANPDNGGAVQGACRPKRRFTVLGINEWGDAAGAYGQCAATSLRLPDGSRHRLGTRSRAILERIMAAGDRTELLPASPQLDPEQVIKVYVDRVNRGRYDEARAIMPTSTWTMVEARLDIKVDSVSAHDATRGREGVIASVRYRVVPFHRHPRIEPERGVVLLSRAPGQAWRIDTIEIGEVVPTGR